METIIRNYPNKKQLLKYPSRFKKEIFDKYKELQNNEDFQNNYKKWKSGINYKTNRKIKIGAKVYNELKSHFIIHYDNTEVFFEELNGIDFEKYLSETDNIYKEIDEQNIIINDYNDKIDTIIEQINKLEKWDDFIEFEGNKYGISEVYDNIHRKNDCLGNFIKGYFTPCTCHWCDGNGGCTNPLGRQCYKCDKCNYQIYEYVNCHIKYNIISIDD
jgi:hypothetical protein